MSEPTKPPLTTTTSIVPAMSVLAIAFITLVFFLAINFIVNPRISPTRATIPIVVGGLRTASHSAALIGCQQAGNPPNNIADAMLVPITSRASGPVVHANGGAGDYDCLRAFVTRATASELLGYYSAQLQARGWNLFSRGATNGSSQLLFQKSGSDTFYWIVGITVHVSGASSSQWTYRIYQNSSTI